MPEVPAAAPTSIPFPYVSVAQRRATDRLAVLIFLASELLLFGALFTSLAAYRLLYPTGFVAAAGRLDLVLGSAATIVIICSSISMALASRASRLGELAAAGRLLVLTAALGIVFLVLKFGEYAEHFRSGLVPGAGFVWSGDTRPAAELFFTFYYVLTGLHAIHLFIGIIILAILYVYARTRTHPADVVAPADGVALYWHFVDLIWAFIFPLLYLISRR